MRTQFNKKLISLLITVMFTLASFYSFSYIPSQAATTPVPSYYDYLSNLTDNDKAVAIGMFFASIGLWTGDMQTDDGISRFSTYLIYDMDAVKTGGISIWSKLSSNGMDVSILASIVKENLTFRASIREFFSIANTLDETAIRALDKNKKMLLYPLDQKFVGRNVALTFVLFKFFDMPVLSYRDKFTIITKNVDFLEQTKSLFTISSAGNVSYSDSAKNFATEMNKLPKTQILKYLPILQDFKVVDTAVNPSGSPGVSPTISPGTPTPKPLPTPRFEIITKKIETLSKKKSYSKTDLLNVNKETDLLMKEIEKWHSVSDRYAIESISCSVRVTYAYNAMIKKTSTFFDRKLITRLISLFDKLRLLPETALSVISLVSKTDQLIKATNSVFYRYKIVSKIDQQNKEYLKSKLSGLVSLLVKFSSKVIVPSKFLNSANKVQLDKTKNVQISSAIAVSYQTAKHFKNMFSKYKMNVSKYFDSNKKYCLIGVEGFNVLYGNNLYISASTSKTIGKLKGTVFLIHQRFFSLEIPSTSLSSKYQSDIFVKCTNYKGQFKILYSSKNVKTVSKVLIAKYKIIGDGRKPSVTFYKVGSKTIKTKMVFDSLLQHMKTTC